MKQHNCKTSTVFCNSPLRPLGVLDIFFQLQRNAFSASHDSVNFNLQPIASHWVKQKLLKLHTKSPAATEEVLHT